LRGYAVHSVGWWAGEDLVAAGDAETADQGVDGFVGADAYEEVFGGEGFGSVCVGVAEVAEELL